MRLNFFLWLLIDTLKSQEDGDIGLAPVEAENDPLGQVIEEEPLPVGNFDDAPVEEEIASDILPDPLQEISVGEQAAEEDVYTSARIAFIILVLGICILLVHYIILKKLHHVPESVSVVFLGAIIGLIGKILKK